MSRQGVWQLQKLVLRYCEFSGSSRGARVFLKEQWPDFTAHNQQIEAAAVTHPGRHPLLIGSYANGTTRSVTVRNADPDEILRQAILLRSSTGRKASLQVKRRQVSKNPSIQGVWTNVLQDRIKGVQASR